jgi:hypothetical protein
MNVLVTGNCLLKDRYFTSISFINDQLGGQTLGSIVTVSVFSHDETQADVKF